MSPITIGLIILTIVSVVVGIRASKNIRENMESPTATKTAPAIFLGAVTLYLLISVIDAWGLGRLQDKVFPLTIGIVTLIGAGALLLRMAMKPADDDVFIDLEKGGDGEAPKGLWSTMSWFVMLVVLTFLTGYIIALVAFLIAFFRRRGGFGWKTTLLSTAIGLAFILGLAAILGRDFPPGYLQGLVDLPWPLT